MKQNLSLVFAGMVGGLIVFLGLSFFQANVPQNTEKIPAKQINQLNIAPSTSVPFDFSKASEIAMPAVVHISVKTNKQTTSGQDDFFRRYFGDDFFGNGMPREGTGSGVIYTNDGYIVTNNHVIESADDIQVTLFDNRKFNATLIGTYPQADLAVLKIDAFNLPILDLANSDESKVGEWVLAVGNPFNLTSTVTAGIISAKGRDIDIINKRDALETFIQTDAAVNPGNSGGALVDANGRLLGINTAIATQTGSYAGYSFAIPINITKKIVEDIIAFGSYQKAQLGVYIMELDDQLAQELNTSLSQGIVIEEVIDGGAAQYSGLLPNDIITEINSKPINTFPDLQESIAQTKIGDVINVTVERKGKVKQIQVKLRPVKKQ